MAVFGFVSGYVGTAGAPFCGSLGQCLQRVVDAGPPWFYPAALIPGAIGAIFLAAVVYVLFLVVHGIRKAFHRIPVASEGLAQSTRPTLPARNGSTQWTRPTPSPLAIRRLALAFALATGVFVALGGLHVWPSVPARGLTYSCTHNLAQPEWDYVLDEATQLCEPTPFIVAEIQRLYGKDPLRHIKPVVDPLSVMSAHPATEGGWSYDPEYLVRAVLAAGVAFVGLAALRVAWRSLR
jgi:hypothetical protein